MIRSYITIALRNILRNKRYSFINILSLSLGVACCILLALYVHDEFSYDRHHDRVEDLYRITSHFQSGKGIDDLTTCSPPIAWGIKDEVPEIESVTRVLNPPGVSLNLFRYNDNIFYETNGFIADSTFFDLFHYEFLEGNPGKALKEANSVVLTEKLAKKLFGDKPALNNLLSISQGGPTEQYNVTGVLKETGQHSFLDANFFISMTSGGWASYLRSPQAMEEWAGQNFVPSFVRLKPGHHKEEVVKKMNRVFLKYGAEDMKALGLNKTLGLEPVEDIYLRSAIGKSPRILYVYVIASIAGFILLIGCINFMNLSTARATQRAAEIGIRKVLGAYRSSLIGQLLGEAMIIVTASILFSMVLVQLVLPFFNEMTGKSISISSGNGYFFGAVLLVIALITSLLAGSYPAFYLSSFEPAAVLKSKSVLSGSNAFLRQSLVIFQFVIAISLICGMMVIGKQLKYMQQSNLGFEPTNKIILPLRTREAQAQYSALISTLASTPSIAGASGGDYMPGSNIWSDFGLYTEGGNMDNAILHLVNRVDYQYTALLNIPLLTGRNFSDNRVSEVNHVLVNRESAKVLGFTPEQAIGKRIFNDFQGKHMTYEIIGVMEDIHQVSLRERIKPVLFMLPEEARYDYILVSLERNNFESTLTSLQQTWKEKVNNTPFEFHFLDETIQQQYDEDKKVSRVITSFTLLALLISCMGLYGLSTYMAERKFKEIGVRKVMGATVTQIVGLMSREFIRLVAIAILVAVPIAWYFMNQWLEGFAYRISVDAFVFVYAGAGALAIALLTVSVESIRAAQGNPVDSLRNQ